tara:strand:- start:508 stop:1266 length:759 start_codon:yes stop_codon:yes gene_type:complete
MKKVNALAVDDEQNNLDLLLHFVKKYCPEVYLIDTASNKHEALELLKKNQYELVFLDMILDDHTAFDILEEISPPHPYIIFVTAHNEFAIESFKYNTVDYILKPIEIESLIFAVNKALKKIGQSASTISLKEIKRLEKALEVKSQIEFITISNVNKVNLIKKLDILYCKSSGRYTEFHLVNNKTLVASKSLGEYEVILAYQDFFRIHNSYIINLYHLVNINKKAGNYCQLKDGTELPISRRRYDKLLQYLNI